VALWAPVQTQLKELRGVAQEREGRDSEGSLIGRLHRSANLLDNRDFISMGLRISQS